jgi:Ca2+-binding EF-hand superfamily protein
LTDEARQLFTKWFYHFSNNNGYMTRNSCFDFVVACVDKVDGIDDYRIRSLFKDYDSNQDGKLELSEFLRFY